MTEKNPKQSIEEVFDTFIQEIETSELSQHLLSIYKELGIEP